MRTYTYQITQATILDVFGVHIQGYKWVVWELNGRTTAGKWGGWALTRRSARRACEWKMRKRRWLG